MKDRADKSKEDGKMAKDHVGNFDRMGWDKNQLLAEVNAYEDGHKINWTNLATRYNVINKDGKLAKNGGQIVKAWLTLKFKKRKGKMEAPLQDERKGA